MVRENSTKQRAWNNTDLWLGWIISVHVNISNATVELELKQLLLITSIANPLAYLFLCVFKSSAFCSLDLLLDISSAVDCSRMDAGSEESANNNYITFLDFTALSSAPVLCMLNNYGSSLIYLWLHGLRPTRRDIIRARIEILYVVPDPEIREAN